MPVYSFASIVLAQESAHCGVGHVNCKRVRERIENSQINFVDIVVVPKGSSVGLHRHSPNDEEVYVVISGSGLMTVDGSDTRVGPGDVIVNIPGGTHGLIADNQDVRMVVIDVSTNGTPYEMPENVIRAE